MGAETAISWTDHTFNLAWGCEKISPGCLNCYAAAQDKSVGGDNWGPGKPRRTFGAKYWQQPLKWNLDAEKEEQPQLVFCSSMTDVFLDDPTVERERAKLWAIIRQTPWLCWQILTKRPERILACLPVDWGPTGYANVWLGVSVENREHGLPRVDVLRMIPAAVRFLSCEPLLEDLGTIDLNGIDWVIVGGESGLGPKNPKYRYMNHAWARSLRDQCDAEEVAFFFKQSSALRPGTGTKLDGRTYHEFPIPVAPCSLAPAQS